jgi:hypothetical protein
VGRFAVAELESKGSVMIRSLASIFTFSQGQKTAENFRIGNLDEQVAFWAGLTDEEQERCC